MSKENETNNNKKSDFQKWMPIKERVDDREVSKDLYIHVGEVWWVSLGKNIGFEQDGKSELFTRPIVVIKVLSRHTFLIAPLTTSKQEHGFRVSVSDFGGKPSKAIVSQIRVIDIKRFQKKIGKVDTKSLKEIKKATVDMIR